MTSLSDKTILITGGGAGLGRAMVQAFMSAGAHVIAVDRNAEALLSLPVGASAAGGTCTTRVLDVCDETAVVACFSFLPRLDVLGCVDI